MNLQYLKRMHRFTRGRTYWNNAAFSTDSREKISISMPAACLFA